MISLKKFVGGRWENVREYLRQDLERIQQWGNNLENQLLGQTGASTIQSSTILGSPTPVPKYVASTGVDAKGNPAPQWDLVDLASTGVKGRLPFGHLQALTAGSRLLGRQSGISGGDAQEISLGSGLSMAGTVLSAAGSGITFKQLAARVSLRS